MQKNIEQLSMNEVIEILQRTYSFLIKAKVEGVSKVEHQNKDEIKKLTLNFLAFFYNGEFNVEAIDETMIPNLSRIISGQFEYSQ